MAAGRGFLAVACLLVLATASSADTILVDWEGGGDYLTISEGIAAAGEGDTVLVAPGVYTGAANCNIDFAGTNRVLTSVAGPESTVIEVAGVGGSAIRFQSDEDTTAVYRGFTIIHADTAVAIDSASPVIDECVIRDPINYVNKVGIFCRFSGAIIRRTQFLWNTGSCERVGLECEFGPGPTVSHCTFSTYGQGIRSAHCSPSVRDCQFLECSASGSSGASCYDGSPVFEDCVFRGCEKNTLFGALCIVLGFGDCPSATVRRTLFDHNAWPGASNAYIVRATTTVYEDTALRLEDVVFWGNRVVASTVRSDADSLFVSRCTFADNEWVNASVSAYAWAMIRDSIIAFNGGTAVEGDPVFTSHSCVFGNGEGDSLAGVHYENLFTWPLFCDHEGGDLTLRDDSPCLPVNNPWGVQIGAYGAGDCGTGIDAQGPAANGVCLRGVHPNPATGSESTVCLAGVPGRDVDIAIYDLRGRRVRTLTARLSGRGRAECPWDLRDDLGRRVASGVYFVEVASAGGAVQRAKLVVVR